MRLRETTPADQIFQFISLQESWARSWAVSPSDAVGPGAHHSDSKESYLRFRSLMTEDLLEDDFVIRDDQALGCDRWASDLVLVVTQSL